MIREPGSFLPFIKGQTVGAGIIVFGGMFSLGPFILTALYTIVAVHIPSFMTTVPSSSVGFFLQDNAPCCRA